MNFRKHVTSLLLATAAIAVTSAPANAATFVFNFGSDGAVDSGATPDIYAATSGALSVTASAYNGLSSIINQVSYLSQADITRTSAGLGVSGNRSGEINDNGLLSLGEGILLTFSEEVTLTQALFSNFTSGDSVDFEFGSPISSGETLDPLAVSGGAWNGSYQGTQFFFAANSLSANSFRLGGVTVNTPSGGGNIPPAAVPEPATWAMMILGFGLVGGFMRRRRDQVSMRFNFG